MRNIKAFLGRGALAGIAGGVAAALFHLLVTEREIRQALAIEAARESGAHEEMFSRGTQVIGGMLGACLYGVFLGLVFGFVCALLWTALSGRGTFTRSIRLAVVIFVAWVLVPALKYPANPPGVGNPDTIGQRTASYLALALGSLLLVFLAWELWKQLAARGIEGAPRFAAVSGAYLLAITVAYLVLPANPDPVDAPANLIWHFRLDSLAGNALMWLVIGITFGWLGDRAIARDTVRPNAAESMSAA